MDDPQASSEADAYVFNGQNSRKGLMLLDRTVREPSIFTESFFLEGTGANALLLNMDVLLIPGSLGMEFNFYANWYGGNAETAIVNSEALNDEAVMIVGDSFGQAM